MIKNHIKIAWRHMIKNMGITLINIFGLSFGMALAILIGFWIWGELSFNKYHRNYDRIAEVMLNRTVDGSVKTTGAIAWALEAEMRTRYGSDLKYIVMTSWTDPHILTNGTKNVSFTGNFLGSDAPEMLGLHMLEGKRAVLKEPSSILLSHSTSYALFGKEDPMGKRVVLDNKASFAVAGVYEDLPLNSTFHDLAFIAPWNFYAGSPDWIQRNPTDWSNNSLLMYVQIADHADMEQVSKKIKNTILNRVGPGEARFKPEIFLHPMSKWHLFSEFKNGVNTGGAIEYVWLFGLAGLFVLLLGCINFMNLSTAQSEKRAKEVGIRKAIGSLRNQLISQFYCESLLMSFLAFALSIVLVWLGLPLFNSLAGQSILIDWHSPWPWIMGFGVALFAGLVAGSYPALYLSSFLPVKVLKGPFRAGRSAAIPRKMLVVLQFAISVFLVTGTLMVYRQIQFSKNRPVGYNREGLINIQTTNNDLYDHFEAARADLLKSGAVSEIAGASSPTTGINNDRSDLSWKGKDPALNMEFGQIGVTTEYGKTVGWQIIQGRDFSRQFLTDSFAIILNEKAVKVMGLIHPVGEVVRVGKFEMHVIGVAKDMVMGSPYEQAIQTIYRLGRGSFDDVIIRINPTSNMHQAIPTIEQVCKIYSPSVPFAFQFVDEAYGLKFFNEERIGRLAGFFAITAILISCLGLLGMASFMAEQRVKEIGIRKVLGASVFGLWGLLSRDFVMLTLCSVLVAAPLAYFWMQQWLAQYSYRVHIAWWIFVIPASGAIAVALLTVSFHCIRAALANPVRSLRSE